MAGRMGGGVVRGSARLAVLGLALLAPSSSTWAAGAVPPVLPTSGAADLQRIAVFGADQRTSVPAALAHAQRKIGLLYNDKARSVCSAFCVAPDVVATAAHCLFRTTGASPPNLSDFVFTPARDQLKDQSKIAGHAQRAAAQNILSGSLQIRVHPPIDAASDWALVRLATPACRHGALPIRPLTADAIAAASRAGKIFQLSYHRDYPNWQLAYSRPCEAGQQIGDVSWSMLDRDFTSAQALILHRCATGGASSGSPLLLDEPGGPYVVGINVGTYILSKVLMREGRVSKRVQQDIIANTAVNATVIADLVARFRESRPLEVAGDLRRLQARLKDLHHYNGPLDGAFGPSLRSAIQDFERTQGLQVTGLPTRDLLRLLERGPPPERAAGTTGPGTQVDTVGINRPASHDAGAGARPER